MKIYQDQDADMNMLKEMRVAVIGYGNQGRSQALNLRDSGLQVIVGNRQDDYATKALEDGFSVLPIHDAVHQGDVIMLLVPDEIMPELFVNDVIPNLQHGDVLVFASGFNIAFDFISPPDHVDVILVAPRMIGAGVRDLFLAGRGFPSFIGVAQDHSGDAFAIALALAKGIGSTKAGVVEVTFAQEAELDLFTEQCFGPAFGQVLVTSVDLLVEQGYPPEAVLLELYMSGEFAYTLSKIAELGMVEQSKLHSLTSQYGSLSRGLRFMLPELREKMLLGLDEIRDGAFAKEWAEEHQADYSTLETLREAATSIPLNQWEHELRGAMNYVPDYQPRSTGIEVHQEVPTAGRPGGLRRWWSRIRPGDKEATVMVEALNPEEMPPVLGGFLGSLTNSPELQDFAQNRQLTVGYYLTDIDQAFYMRFNDGRVSGALGLPQEGADVTLETQSDTLDGMFTGRLNAMRAAMSGDLKFEGDTRQAMAIQRVQDELCRLYQLARSGIST